MRFHRSFLGAALASLTILAVAATALAAHPKKAAKFSGTLLNVTVGTTTSPIMFGKFHAPVSFKVSSSGADLLSFKYGYTGCFGFGGVPTTTDIYTHYGNLHNLGKIAVAADGSFNVKNVKSIHKTSGSSGTFKFKTTLTTTSTVVGNFTSARKASGTISFTQRDVVNGKASTCGPALLNFTAKAR